MKTSLEDKKYSDSSCTIIEISAIDQPMQHIIFSIFSPSEFKIFIEKMNTINFFYKASSVEPDQLALDRRHTDMLCEKVTDFAILYADKLKKIAKAK